jgi:hypothetical protein
MITAIFLAVLVTSENPHTVDFGPDATAGYAAFSVRSVNGPATGAVVRVAYANHPDRMTERGDFWHETRADYLGKDILLPIAPSSTDRFELYPVKGPGEVRSRVQQGLVRYARISVDTPGARVEIGDFRLENRFTYSEEPVVGSFSCSDARLTALWNASVRTCQLSAIPKRGDETLCAYLSDGAKRDRLVWSGDLWWADINMYAAYACDSPYMPGSLRMLALAQTPEGYVQACPFPEAKTSPAAGEWGPFASDEFAAWFVPVLRNYALYTGDLELTRKLYPAMVRLVDYLGRHTKDGLFIQRRETCKNAGALRFGASSLHHRSYMQILLWKTLSDAADVAIWLKEAEFAARCRSEASKIASVTRHKFRDKDGASFVFSLEDRAYSADANALALAVGFVSDADAAVIAPKIPRNWHGKFQALAARGRFAYGYGELALRSLEEHGFFTVTDPEWKGCRTTYECMDVKMPGWGDEAHPDTAVAGILTAYVLGVRPVSPGYETFVFDPSPPASVSSAKGVVPTPRGLIKAEWRRENGRIVRTLSAPDGIREVKTAVVVQ